MSGALALCIHQARCMFEDLLQPGPVRGVADSQRPIVVVDTSGDMTLSWTRREKTVPGERTHRLLLSWCPYVHVITGSASFCQLVTVSTVGRN